MTEEQERRAADLAAQIKRDVGVLRGPWGRRVDRAFFVERVEKARCQVARLTGERYEKHPRCVQCGARIGERGWLVCLRPDDKADWLCGRNRCEDAYNNDVPGYEEKKR